MRGAVIIIIQSRGEIFHDNYNFCQKTDLAIVSPPIFDPRGKENALTVFQILIQLFLTSLFASCGSDKVSL